MGIGDLVKNTRAGIGLPAGMIGLIIEKHVNETLTIFRVLWHNGRSLPTRLERDLEVIG